MRPGPPVDDKQVLAAWLYYNHQLTQQQVANRLDVSRATVVRLLRAARENGLVEIRILAPIPFLSESAIRVEEDLRTNKASKLERVIVGAGKGPLAAASAASNFLIDHVGFEDVVGFGWSSTLAQMPDLARSGPLAQHVVQLAGAVGSSSGESFDIAVRAADDWRGRLYALPAPAIVQDPRTAEALRCDQTIARTLAAFPQCTVAVIGIGIVSHDSTMVKAGYLTASDAERLSTRGAVADLLGWHLDTSGQIVPDQWADCRIGMSIEQLRPIKQVVAVAAGGNKAEAVRAAIASETISVLIVDEELAMALQS